MSYQFASEPQTLALGARSRYRPSQPLGAQTMTNLMNDKRIVRGSTYGAQNRALARTMMQAPSPAAAPRKVMRTGKIFKGPGPSVPPGTVAERGMTQDEIDALPAPEPVEGRRHTALQTDVYYEDLRKVTSKEESETQTDPELDRPSTPLFDEEKQRLHLHDIATSTDARELFDFDLEAEPVLSVLVMKSLDEALMEVLEEQEMLEMEAHAGEHAQVRDVELVEVQRLAQRDHRRTEERTRRLQQQADRLVDEHEQSRRRMAATMAKDLILETEQKIIGGLERAGYFYDPIVKEVKEQFMPWALVKADGQLQQANNAQQVVDELLWTAAQQNQGEVAQAHDKSQARAYYQKGARSGIFGQAHEHAEITGEHRREALFGKAEPKIDLASERARTEALRAQVRADLSTVDRVLQVQTLARKRAAVQRVDDLRKGPTEEEKRKSEKPKQTLKRLKASFGVKCKPRAQPEQKAPAENEPEDEDGEDETGRRLPGLEILRLEPPLGGASHASLVAGDILLRVSDYEGDEGEDVRRPAGSGSDPVELFSLDDLATALAGRLPGDMVNVTVLRGTDGREETLPLEVSCVHRMYPLSEIRQLREEAGLPMSDAKLYDADTALAKIKATQPKIGCTLKDGPKRGVLVNKVVGDPAQSAGLNMGDLILTLNGRPVDSNKDLVERLAKLMPGDQVQVQVWRKPQEPDSDDEEGDEADQSDRDEDQDDSESKRTAAKPEIKAGAGQPLSDEVPEDPAQWETIVFELGPKGSDTIEWIRALRTMAGLPVLAPPVMTGTELGSPSAQSS